MTNNVTETGGHKKKTNGYSNATLHAKRNQRRKDADMRQALYEAKTLKEKFDSLVPGGSKRQRARLEKQLAEAAARGIPTQPAQVTEPKKTKNGKKKAS